MDKWYNDSAKLDFGTIFKYCKQRSKNKETYQSNDKSYQNNAIA